MKSNLSGKKSKTKKKKLFNFIDSFRKPEEYVKYYNKGYAQTNGYYAATSDKILFFLFLLILLSPVAKYFINKYKNQDVKYQKIKKYFEQNNIDFNQFSSGEIDIIKNNCILPDDIDFNLDIMVPENEYKKFKNIEISRFRNYIFYGGAGIGKTVLVNAICKSNNFILFTIDESILSKWVGETEKKIKGIYETALKLHNKSVIFIDEVDGFGGTRVADNGGFNKGGITRYLLQIIEQSQQKILWFGATNYINNVDSAFRSRFILKEMNPLSINDKALLIEKMIKHYNINVLDDNQKIQLINKLIDCIPRDIRANLKSLVGLKKITSENINNFECSSKLFGKKKKKSRKIIKHKRSKKHLK